MEWRQPCEHMHGVKIAMEKHAWSGDTQDMHGVKIAM